jgi:hypothetical protein
MKREFRSSPWIAAGGCEFVPACRGPPAFVLTGFQERFITDQVGHAYAATTAIYTGVSDDYKNRVLAKALAGGFGVAG